MSRIPTSRLLRSIAVVLCAIVAIPSPVALAIGLGISPKCDQGMKLWLGERCLASEHAPLDAATRDAVEQMWASACGAPDTLSPALLDRDAETSLAMQSIEEEIRLAQRDGRTDSAQYLCCVSVHRLLLMTGGPWAPANNAGSLPASQVVSHPATMAVVLPATTIADEPPPPRDG